MKQSLIVANWKLNPPSLKEARALFLAAESVGGSARVSVVVAAPFVYLAEGKTLLKRTRLGAQDVFWEERGAYTGAVGPQMLKGVGASYVIIGHSERREHFGETNEVVHAKVKAALTAGLRIILCVGEKSRDGDPTEAAAFIKEEVVAALRGTPKKYAPHITIAYEPIWAISGIGGVPDTPASTREMAIFIRKTIFDFFGARAARSVAVLYGGSANPKNARAFLEEGGVDGLLVGHASISAASFTAVVHVAARARRMP